MRRFHYEIEALRSGEVTGWCAPSAVRASLPESNVASGTAVRIRPGAYPAGARGGFTPPEELVLRDVLAVCEGTVRWGGDDRAPDESLFSLDVPPGDPALTGVAGKIRDWAFRPGSGAGGPARPTPGAGRVGRVRTPQRNSRRRAVDTGRFPWYVCERSHAPAPWARRSPAPPQHSHRLAVGPRKGDRTW